MGPGGTSGGTRWDVKPLFSLGRGRQVGPGGTSGGTRWDVKPVFLLGGDVPPRLGFIKLKSERGGAQDGRGGAGWAHVAL